MGNITLDVIVERLDNLAKSVESGFQGVHQRQDRTNGRIDKAEKEIQDNTMFRVGNNELLNNIKRAMYGVVAMVCVAIIALIFK